MPPLYPSPGPFPNHRALNAVGKDQLLKAYYEAGDLKGARQPNRRPPQTLTATVAPPGDLLENQSHEHRHFKQPRADLAKNERVPPPLQALEMGGSAIDPPKKSNYAPRQRATPWEGYFTEKEQKIGRNLDMSVLNVRRNPYTSPGN
eukprot:Skav230016  [mRNA]  locus=scaffold769:243114:257622:- [translate_table: standard]